MPARSRRTPVLIASWLDAPHVHRIATAEPERSDVLYAPELLPQPRYEADHHGPRPGLSAEEHRRWRGLVARAVISFEFDWDEPAAMLRSAPALRWVQCTSSGIGPMLKRIGVAGSPLLVTNAAGIHARPLAEFVVMAALYFTKELPRLSAWKARRHWERYCGSELAGGRMLLVGLGRVGSRVAELAAGLGISVVGVVRGDGSRAPPGVSRLVRGDQLDAELAAADWLVLAAPETPETVGLITRQRLALLPQRAVVINVSRGSLIDEGALVEALTQGRLRGAALDVFAQEPLPPDSPLWALPNVIISPHSASTVAQENDRLVTLFIDNLHRFLDGRPLVNVFRHST